MQALNADPAVLLNRAERLAAKLSADGIDARAVMSQAAVGGGGAPCVRLPSAAVSLPEPFGAALRGGDPAVAGRVEEGRLLLDLRAVPPECDPDLIAAVSSASTAGCRP